MSALIEITGDDIAALGDADLRELIGLLCEDDYRAAGLPLTGIRYGGHQDAPDGGLDVVVRGKESPSKTSFVPRSNTGFQVKKPDMPAAEITNEMRPNGILRDSIKDLMQENGAYIIVSSAASTTDSALSKRTKAMKDAVAEEENSENLHLDFFDRGHVATWTRSHPNRILWVRNKIGKPLPLGWQLYGNWANAPGGVEEEYLLAAGPRLQNGVEDTGQLGSAENCLLKLRSDLSKPGKSVRLIGLSGVGKTRLVQALFDDRVRENALAKSLAIYTDMSVAPDPDPVTFANNLINGKERKILIIDNCSPSLHHCLTEVCTHQESTVSLLTVEYDVRDDLPEKTRVIKLEPTSEGIIRELISKRFSHINQDVVEKIANLSDGNARVAIVLADAVQQQGVTLSELRNENLFKKLFWQRNAESDSLLASAQVFSLVYSFNVGDDNSEKSELGFLASLTGNEKTHDSLYRDLATLKERDLIQSRSVWRALLPHAIANRLAKQGLKSIRKGILVNRFLDSSTRLIESFALRLNYLYDCKEASDVVNDWLGEDRWNGKTVNNINGLGINVLKNFGPVSPNNTLAAIERVANGVGGDAFTSSSNSHAREFARLLRHLAYDSALFDRSVALLCRYALTEDKNEYYNYNSIPNVLKSLFYLYYSGTHASIESRVKVIEELLDSEDQDKQELGLFLLDAALEARKFSGWYEYDFGTMSRDAGYYPETREDRVHWFDSAISICTRTALSGQPIASQAKKLLANKLGGLWARREVFEALEESAKQIRAQGAWNDGWVAVREVMKFDGKDLDDEAKEKLYKLEKLLKPASLFEEARTFLFTNQHENIPLEDVFGDEEDPSAGYRRMEERIEKIGAKVAQDVPTLKRLLPDIVSRYSSRAFSFGVGLAEGASDKKELFQALYTALEKTSAETRKINVFLGFLSSCYESDPSLHNFMLDKSIKDDVLGEWFPEILQRTSTIDHKGVKRLHDALDLGKAPIRQYECLAYGRAHESISDDDLAGLMKKIISKEGGLSVAFIILKMRLHGQNKGPRKHSDSLVAIARDMVMAFSFDKERCRQEDYGWALIVSTFLKGPQGICAATAMCQNIKKSRAPSFLYQRLITNLARVQPTVFLDVFLTGYADDYKYRMRFINVIEEMDENPLSQISDDVLLSWCEKEPLYHYPAIASAMESFKKSNKTGKYEWKPFVYTILDKAPILEDVLVHLADGLRPAIIFGSCADFFQKLVILYHNLYEHNNEEVVAWAKSQHAEMQKMIGIERQQEGERDRGRRKSFE